MFFLLNFVLFLIGPMVRVVYRYSKAGDCFLFSQTFCFSSKKDMQNSVFVDLSKFIQGDKSPSREQQHRELSLSSVLSSSFSSPFSSDWSVEAVRGDSILVSKRPGLHALVATLDRAFNDHLHLKLRPDDLLLPLLQQVAMARNRQDVGKVLEPKKQLTVNRSDFAIGGGNNQPWNELFEDFRKQIHSIVKGDASMFIPGFSTTNPLMQSAYDVSLMDAFQSVFSYHNS